MERISYEIDMAQFIIPQVGQKPGTVCQLDPEPVQVEEGIGLVSSWTGEKFADDLAQKESLR